MRSMGLSAPESIWRSIGASKIRWMLPDAILHSMSSTWNSRFHSPLERPLSEQRETRRVVSARVPTGAPRPVARWWKNATMFRSPLRASRRFSKPAITTAPQWPWARNPETTDVRENKTSASNEPMAATSRPTPISPYAKCPRPILSLHWTSVDFPRKIWEFQK